MFQRCFTALAARLPRRIAAPLNIRSKAVRSAATSVARRSYSKTPKPKAKPFYRSPTSRQRRRKPLLRRTATSKAMSNPGEGENRTPNGVKMNKISVSLVVPQEPPVRSRCTHPTEFLGSTDPLLLTPIEKAEVEAATKAAAQAAAGAAAAQDVATIPGKSLAKGKTGMKMSATVSAARKVESRGAGNKSDQKLKRSSPRAAARKAIVTSAACKTAHGKPGATAITKKESSTPNQRTVAKLSKSVNRGAKQVPSAAARKQSSVFKSKPQKRTVRRTAAAKIRTAAALSMERGGKTAARRVPTAAGATKIRPPFSQLKGMRLVKKSPVRHAVTNTLKKRGGKRKR